MECPHCHETLPSKPCKGCGREVPEESIYCLYCGVSFEEEDTPFEGEDGGPDFENRILCPDGTCTGIIENGKCTECGRPYEGGGREPDTDD